MLNRQCLFKWNWLPLVSQITHIWLAHCCRGYRKRGDGGRRVPRTLSPFLHFSVGNQYCLLNYWANLIRGTAVLTALWPSNCQEAAWSPAVQILNAATIIENTAILLQPCQNQRSQHLQCAQLTTYTCLTLCTFWAQRSHISMEAGISFVGFKQPIW